MNLFKTLFMFFAAFALSFQTTQADWSQVESGNLDERDYECTRWNVRQCAKSCKSEFCGRGDRKCKGACRDRCVHNLCDGEDEW